MKKASLFLFAILLVAISCKKDSEDEIIISDQEKYENLFCKHWQRKYLTINSDTSYYENWIFERVFMKDKTYVLNITRLGGPGEEDEFSTDTTLWRWSGDYYSAIELQSKNDEEVWYFSRVPKLTETELILEQDRDNDELFRFHYENN